MKRSAAGLLAALVLTVLSVVVGPVARADPITTQPYLALYDIAGLHAQGLDGTGVTIAFIDGPVDMSFPELAGMNITTIPTCQVDFDPKTVSHGSAMAAILASQAYGWAPKARILNYTLPTEGDKMIRCPDLTGHDIGYVVQQALNDGADIISISRGGYAAGTSAFLAAALIRAMDMGVPVVIAMGNDSVSYAVSDAIMNTTIGVGAVDASGKKAAYSDYGKGLTLMAYGGPVNTRGPDEAGNQVLVEGTSGTSNAAPMVAGALALAKQKWPQANGNQLTRVLADVADGVADHKGIWTPEMGEGTLNPALLIATDPSGYDTTNNFMQKTDQHPTAQDIQDYHDGLMDPFWTNGDPNYVYRGCDPDIIKFQPTRNPTAKMSPGTAPECQNSPSGTQSPTMTAPATTPPPTTTPGGASPTTPGGATAGSNNLTWWLAGLGALLLIAAIVIALAVRAHRRPPAATPNLYHPGQPMPGPYHATGVTPYPAAPYPTPPPGPYPPSGAVPYPPPTVPPTGPPTVPPNPQPTPPAGWTPPTTPSIPPSAQPC